jgi:hypothetical protein
VNQPHLVQVPDPIRCPIIHNPHLELANIDEFDQLRSYLALLRSGHSTLKPAEFRRGAIELDGRLDLCKQGLGAEGAKAILSDLGGTPVRHVLLGTNAIGTTGLVSLATATATDSVIETIYLGCNGITAETLPLVTEAVTTSSSVRALWLKRNPLGPSAAPAIARMIDESHLHTLDLVATGLNDKCFTPIALALANSSTLRHLFLSGNGFTSQTCEALADWISGPIAESLHLSANPLGDDGVHILADAMDRRSTAMNVSIASAGLTPASAKALSRIAATTKHLELGRSTMARAVRATDNEIGDEGLEAIASSLATLSLHWLDIRHCRFSDAGLKSLAKAMHGDHSLEHLDIGAGIDRKIKAHVRSLLRPPTNPRTDWHIRSRYR